VVKEGGEEGLGGRERGRRERKRRGELRPTERRTSLRRSRIRYVLMVEENRTELQRYPKVRS